VPVSADTRQLALTADGRDLDVVSRSAGAPTITAATHAGEAWTGVQNLTWTVTDSDGDAVDVNVLYSPNNGESWLPFAPDVASGHVSVGPAYLQSGNSNLFRLIASDGFNTTTTDIGPISVADGGGTDLGMGGGCAFERDCEPTASPAPSGTDSSAGLIAIVGLALLLLVGGSVVGFVLLNRRPRHP
jgi:hypothetical protein